MKFNVQRLAHIEALLAHSRRRGSTLLLVLAALLLSLILGLTYLEVVRLDRRSTANIRTQGDMDAVIQSVLDLIAARIGGDLGIQTNGANSQYFAIDGDGDSNTGEAEEPYDYPGDKDRWLAATAPNRGSTLFPQVTELRAPQNNLNPFADLGTTDSGRQHTAVGSATLPDKAYYRAGDADGDGITDSRPQKAPIDYLNNVNYYMWVRIIDNSSMLNVNTAGVLTNASGMFDAAADAGRGVYGWEPVDVDLGYFAAMLGDGASALRLLQYRQSGAVVPAPPMLRSARELFWQDEARFDQSPTSAYRKFDIANEVALRHRNGLNSGTRADIDRPDDPATPANENVMHQLLRGDLSAERTYLDVSATIEDYFENEPRHQLTTLSGHSVIRRNLPNDTAGRQLKRDLNALMNAPGDLSREIAKILGNYNHAGSNRAGAALAAQFTANIIDYADNNARTELAGVTEGGATYYGLEAMAFSAEVYVQYAYRVTQEPRDAASLVPVSSPVPLPPVGSVPAYVWTKQSPTGVAIELRNPFRKPVNLRGLSLRIGAYDEKLEDLISAGTVEVGTAFSPAHQIPAGGTLVLYQNSAGGAGNNAMSSKIDTTEPVVGIRLAPAHQINAFNAGTQVDVEFLAEATVDGAAAPRVVYQRITVKATDVKDTYAIAAVAAPTVLQRVPQDPEFKQRATLGNGEGLNVMAIQSADFKSEINYTENAAKDLEFPAPYQDIDALGVAQKGGPAALLNPADNDKMQFLLSDRGTVVQLGELAMIPILGPTNTQTVPEAWNARNNIEQFYFDFTGIVATDDVTAPHKLLTYLTTLSPAEDGVNNDGAGGIDDAAADGAPSEMFLHGTININTAPTELLERVLPLPNLSELERGAIADLIVNYRANATGARPNLHRAAFQGFFSTSELLHLDLGGSQFGVDNQDNPTINGTAVDFHHSGDGVYDDREERTLLARWLGQIGAVRSDVFTAYVLVRGYRGNSTAPESEQRVVVLIDRSRMMQQGDRPRITWLAK